MDTELSEAKLEANRRNALKSTGPRTRKGKKKSKYNALKHGLTAKTLLLPGLENPKDFKRVLRGFLNDLDPKGTLEKTLVQRLAADFQRIQRVCRVERAAFVRPKKRARELPSNEMAAQRKKRLRGPLKIDGFGPIDLLLRYQAGPVRDFDRTLKTLQGVQQLRKKEERKWRKKSATRRAVDGAGAPEGMPRP